MRFLLLLLCIACVFSNSAPASAQPGADISPDDPTVVLRRLFHALDVKFESGQHAIHPYALSALDAVADVLIRFPDLRLEIAGHTDVSGSSVVNLRLSEQRARSVQAYLVARHGIDADRLEIAGHGASFPVASNSSAAGRALNRRVEFRLIDAPEPSAGAPDRPSPLTPDPDSVREALERQVEEAVRAALSESSAVRTPANELEERLQERLALLESQLAEEELAPTAIAPTMGAQQRGLLPFTGFYLRGDIPILLGLRIDLPTSLFGSARFQPEAAVGFRTDDRVYSVGANLVFPIRIQSQPSLVPFIGAGVGFHDVDSWEAILNILVGVEKGFEFGILFGELMTQDFFDYTRVIVGFRQRF